MNLSPRRVGGLSLSVWLLIVAVTTLIPEFECITVAEKKSIKKGILSGKEILNIIKEKKFHETLTKMATSMGPYIGAIAPFTGFIMTFIPAEDSAELKAIKDLSKDMNNQFDQVDNSLKNIEKKIDWSQVEIKFGEIEQNIWLLDEEYRLFVNSAATASNKKNVFVTTYENSYDGAGTKLYQACVKEGSWTTNLRKSVAHYTDNHRKETQAFLLGVEALMIQAMRIELNYLELMDFSIIKTEREVEWKKRQVELSSKFNETDQELITVYNDQASIDTNKLATDNVGLSNEQFNTKLYDLLTEKYYWRDWYVVIFDYFPRSWKDQSVSRNKCDGFNVNNQNNRRTIVVASLHKESAKMDIVRAQNEFNRCECKKYHTWPIYHIWVDGEKYGYMNDDRMIDMQSKIDKSFSCSLAVMISGSHPFYKAPKNRAVVEWKSEDCKTYMFMFG